MVEGRTSYSSYVMIGSEATWGTPVAAVKDVGYLQTINLDENNNLIQVKAVAFRDVQTNAAGKYAASGSMEVAYQHSRLLTFLFGTPTHANSGSDWAHVFNTNNSALPSFTLEAGVVGPSTTTIYKAEGVKLNNGTFAIDTEGVLTLKTDFLAQKASASSTAQTYSGQTLPVYSAYAATVSTGAPGSEVAVAEARSFELTINETLTPVYVLTQRENQAITEGGRNYEFRMSLVFANENEHAKFLGGSTSPVNGTLSSQNIVFQVLKDTTAFGSGKRGLFISLGNANYNAVNTPIPTDGVIYQDFTGYATFLNNASAWDNISSGSFL